MRSFIDPSSSKQLQWFLWLGVLFILFFAMLPQDGFYPAATYTLLNTAFYAVVIYMNVNVLFPVFYDKGHKVQYGIWAFVFIVVLSVIRVYMSVWIDNRFFVTKPETVDLVMIANFVMADLLIYLLSFIFRPAIGYFTLKQQSEQLVAQKSEAELNLLKSQVQPHFLFNTLNNIYYETYKDAPNGAKLIARLAEIMRYFVDESPKCKVDIATEIKFLENYIALEKIRIKHPIELNFIKQFDGDIQVPPMLLMAFVENIFKHGIDKINRNNKVDISLVQQDNFLVFSTRNQVCDDLYNNDCRGFGIENLRKRLNLLYPSNFELTIDESQDYFNAFLKFPVGGK